MEEFKMCSDGEFMPVSLPCPPPFSGPAYYYYPFDSTPIPPAGGSSHYESDGGGDGGAPISAAAVAGIILVGLVIVMVFFLTIRFRTRLFGGSIVRLSSTRNSRNMELHQVGAAAAELASTNSGDVLLDVVDGGLEEKLVNLLPVYEYVSSQDNGKQLLDVQQQKGGKSSSCSECAVCLSLFEEKDIVRILPKCKHVFHLYCIDKWFESHANCPLCRERITLQTIQLFLMRSEDRAIDVDDHRQPCLDDHHQQLAEFDACPDTHNNLTNQHDPAPHHSCTAPHGNQIDTPLSAACHVDGHHATKPYQNTEQKHEHSTEFTPALLEDKYPYHYQSFSFPTNPAAQIDQKEVPCLVHRMNHKAARSPPLWIESNQPGVSTYHKIIRAHSQRFGIERGEGNEKSAIAVMSSLHDSSRPLPKLLRRSHSAGFVIEHYLTSPSSRELL